MADTEARSGPSWSTILAAVLCYLATAPFVYYAIKLAVMRGEMDSLLRRDDLIYDQGTVESFRSLAFVVIFLFGVASVIAIILARRLLRRSPGAREMGRTFFGLMVGAALLLALTASYMDLNAEVSLWFIVAALIDAGIVGVLSLGPSREEFEKLSLERWERRYYKDLERTQKREERLRRKAAKSG